MIKGRASDAAQNRSVVDFHEEELSVDFHGGACRGGACRGGAFQGCVEEGEWFYGVVLGESGMKLGLLIPYNSARVPVSGVYRIVFSIPIRESTYVFTIFCHHSL